MRILFVSDFQRELPYDLRNNVHRFSKGFTRNGHDVVEFSYRHMLMQTSPIKSKRWAVRLAKGKVDAMLARIAKDYQPDLVVMADGKRTDADTVQKLRNVAPNAVYAAYYENSYGGCDPRVIRAARQCDWFLATSAGAALQDYKSAGVPHCAFIPNAADPDLEGPRQVDAKWRSEVVFIGKLQHRLEGQDPDRADLIRSLATRPDVTVWGCLGRPSIEGVETVNALCGAKIALSINVYNDVQLYHSDRLTHCLSHGAFTLAKYVPDSERMYRDGEHLRYFRTNEECVAMIDQYLADEPARAKIAAAGMEHAHTAFSCQTLAACFEQIVMTGQCDAAWTEII